VNEVDGQMMRPTSTIRRSARLVTVQSDVPLLVIAETLSQLAFFKPNTKDIKKRKTNTYEIKTLYKK